MAALRQSAVGFVVVLVVAMAAAAVEGAGKNVDCTSLVVQKMADCLPFVTNATVDKPEGNCCSGLKTVLKNGPNCLCEVFKSSSQFGITVNVSKAASLPSACHVHAPSVTKCGVSVSPAGAPAVSPAGAPSSTANPPSASAGLTGLVPAAAPAEKGSSSTIRVSVGLVLALIGGAIFSSF